MLIKKRFSFYKRSGKNNLDKTADVDVGLRAKGETGFDKLGTKIDEIYGWMQQSQKAEGAIVRKILKTLQKREEITERMDKRLYRIISQQKEIVGKLERQSGFYESTENGFFVIFMVTGKRTEEGVLMLNQKHWTPLAIPFKNFKAADAFYQESFLSGEIVEPQSKKKYTIDRISLTKIIKEGKCSPDQASIVPFDANYEELT
jgi:hypothetical protein